MFQFGLLPSPSPPSVSSLPRHVRKTAGSGEEREIDREKGSVERRGGGGHEPMANTAATGKPLITLARPSSIGLNYEGKLRMID